MSDDEQRTERASGESPRRFKLGRRVNPQAPPGTREQRELREAAIDDDTLRGNPHIDRELGRGCTGCLKVMGLLFLIMAASIITTYCINKR